MTKTYSVNLARANAGLDAVKEAGLAFRGRTIYAVGTPLDDSGQGIYRASRLAWEDKPLCADAAAAFRELVARQDRRDFSFELPGARMLEDGRLALYDTTVGFPISAPALSQLMSRAGAPGGAGQYLAGCPVDMRRGHVNYWLPLSAGEDAVEAVARTMLDDVGRRASRGVYAVVSSRYDALDGPDAVDAAAAALPRDGRSEFVVDGPRWSFRTTFHSDLLPTEVVVGDVLRAWVSVRARDDGRGGFRVAVGVDQARCRNCTEIHAVNVAAAAHVGDAAAKLVALVRRQFGKVAGFAEAWAAATVDHIVEGLFEGVEPAYVFAQLVDRGLVTRGGVGRDEMVERLVRHCKGAVTRWEVVNAVTEAAHSESWSSPWITEEMEEQAGELLYNRVYVAPPDVAARAAEESDRFSKVML